QRHPDSPFPIPERVLPAGLARTPEAINQCAAAKALYYDHGVFPPVRVVDPLRLRSEPRRVTIDDSVAELEGFGFGFYMELPPVCFTAALEPLGPDHFVEWVTGLEWQFLSEAPDTR